MEVQHCKKLYTALLNGIVELLASFYSLQLHLSTPVVVHTDVDIATVTNKHLYVLRKHQWSCISLRLTIPVVNHVLFEEKR